MSTTNDNPFVILLVLVLGITIVASIWSVANGGGTESIINTSTGLIVVIVLAGLAYKAVR